MREKWATGTFWTWYSSHTNCNVFHILREQVSYQGPLTSNSRIVVHSGHIAKGCGGHRVLAAV
jgi:hypothetical protein